MNSDDYLFNGMIILFIIFAIADLVRYNNDLKKIKEFERYNGMEGKITNVSYETVETSFFWGVPVFFFFIGWVNPVITYKLIAEYDVNGIKGIKNVSYIDKYMDKLDAEKMVSYLKNNPKQIIFVSPKNDEYYLFLNDEKDIVKPYSAGLWLFCALLTYKLYNISKNII